MQAILSPSGRVTFESLEPMCSRLSLNCWRLGRLDRCWDCPQTGTAHVTRLQTSQRLAGSRRRAQPARAEHGCGGGGAGLRFSSLRLTAGDGFRRCEHRRAGSHIPPGRVLQTFDAVPAGLEPGVLGPLTLAGNARVPMSSTGPNAVVTLDDQRAQGSASIIDPVPSIRASLIGGNLDLGPYLNLASSQEPQAAGGA